MLAGLPPSRQCRISQQADGSDIMAKSATIEVERVQTGVRLEKRLLKVLKALAEYLDLTLGDLLEGIALHAIDGKEPFTAATRKRAVELAKIYGLTLDSRDSHKLRG
jgi:predicted DNA-binding ribbon-helix-helix protein